MGHGHSRGVVGGQPITPFQAIMRNILRDVDAQPLWFYQIGLLAAMSNNRFQRLGDMAVDTMVVVEEHGSFEGSFGRASRRRSGWPP